MRTETRRPCDRRRVRHEATAHARQPGPFAVPTDQTSSLPGLCSLVASPRVNTPSCSRFAVAVACSHAELRTGGDCWLQAHCRSAPDGAADRSFMAWAHASACKVRKVPPRREIGR